MKLDGVTCCHDSANTPNEKAEARFSILYHGGAFLKPSIKSKNHNSIASRLRTLIEFNNENCYKSASARSASPLNYLYRILIPLTALLIFYPVQAQKMFKGSAIVTSKIGYVSAVDASGKEVSTALHEIMHPAGLTLSTKKDARIFLTFSNGISLALNEASAVQCVHYFQLPFDKEDQALGLEPSVSNLKLSLIKGQIAVASNRISPLSNLRIQLPKGELRLHKGTCLINLDETGLHITAYDGNLTYYYPESESREFVSAPKGIRISDQSIQRQQIAEATTVESLKSTQTLLCQATQHASKRVNFQANDSTNLPAKPVLIVRPQYFEQPSYRPYQFEE